MDPCKICGAADWVVSYDGPVRSGTFGKSVHGVVYKCGKCGVEFLPPQVDDLEAYYRDGTYRDSVNESSDIGRYFSLHDGEQLKKYGVLEGIPLRGRVFADVGCGGGSFLDGVKGFASKTIAIEPTITYHQSLKARGHVVYKDALSALAECKGSIDVATAFSVIEHVENPVSFLREVRALLANDGQLILSTPNLKDFLLQSLVSSYRGFFYRTAHIHYFDQSGLKMAAEAAGYSSVSFKYVHRFNFSNFMGWLLENKPTGNSTRTVLGAPFDAIWGSQLEASGASDYLYAYLAK